MPWIYHQTTGELLRPDGSRHAFGFAGQQDGLNNPAKQSAHNIGPLPVGNYSMTGWIESDDHLGMCVIVLNPLPANAMFGRAGFRIHGARALDHAGLAKFLVSSEGCICVGDCVTRRAIWSHGDRVLKVIS